MRPEAGSGAERAAFEELVTAYAGPIRTWLRLALAESPEAAEDLAQDFFAWAFETGFLSKADPARGRFRAFLKTALRNYAADRHRKAMALRRGGGQTTIPLHAPAEESGAPDHVDRGAPRPDDALDEHWRKTVIAQALEGVRSELAATGKASSYEVFREYFLDAEDDVDYGALAARHGITRTDVSNQLMRVKQLYRKHLRSILESTVAGPEQLEDEIAWLLGGRR